MIKTIDIAIPASLAEDSLERLRQAASALDISPERISSVRIKKRSIDGRSREVRVQLRLEVYVDEPAPEEPLYTPNYPILPRSAKQVVLVGAGPASLFAALTLIEHGVKPVILERGK